MEEFEFTRYVVPLRDRMFRYAQSLLLCADEAEDVRRARACLPERQREVLHLKDIEGYPTREIAEIAACDEAQVRVILSRARNGLREVLKKMMDDERAGRKN